jgi:hypothetical protein
VKSVVSGFSAAIEMEIGSQDIRAISYCVICGSATASGCTGGKPSPAPSAAWSARRWRSASWDLAQCASVAFRRTAKHVDRENTTQSLGNCGFVEKVDSVMKTPAPGSAQVTDSVKRDRT